MTALRITGHDNRGPVDAPFGYIYFERRNAEWRVGYTSSRGVFGVGLTPNDLKPGEVSALIAYAIKHKLADREMV